MATVASFGMPVTALALGPFTALYFALVGNVIGARIRNQTFFGNEVSQHKRAETPAPAAAADGKPKPLSWKSNISEFDQLAVASRVQGNFVENVPIALILAGAVEANGGDRVRLAATLAVLFLARVSHAYGLNFNNKGRMWGFGGTAITQIVLGVWSTYLGYSALF